MSDILWWSVEPGRIHIITEVSFLSSFNIPPHRGRLELLIGFSNTYIPTRRAAVLYLMTWKSQSRILIFLNNAPITWYNKWQNTVEASRFGLEFIVLRVGYKMNKRLRCKLRMMGVPVKGPTNIYCDNEAVVGNSSMAKSTWKKKHLSACYHKTCETYAKGAVHTGYDSPENDFVLKSWQVIINTRRPVILYTNKYMHDFNYRLWWVKIK